MSRSFLPFGGRPVPQASVEHGCFSVHSVHCSVLFEANCRMSVENPKGPFVLLRRRYRSVQELELIPFGKQDASCARFLDRYGNRVLSITEEVPCFDSGDEKYDSYHRCYFVRGIVPAVLYCGGGWDGISELQVYYGIRSLGPEYEETIRAFGITPLSEMEI